MTDVKEQLRAYFDEVDPPFDPAGLMREPHPAPVPHRSVVGRGVLVAGAAAAVLVLALALPLLFLANASQTSVEPSVTKTEAPAISTESATTTEVSAEVFSFREHDLSDWVTEDEMTAVLAHLSIEYAGTRLDGEAELALVDRPAPVDYHLVRGGEVNEAEWAVGSVDRENHWAVGVHNGDHLPDELWSHETDLELPKGEITTGGWGVFTVRGPNSDESFCISLEAPTEIFGTYVEEDIYKEMISALASMILEELGWVD